MLPNEVVDERVSSGKVSVVADARLNTHTGPRKQELAGRTAGQPKEADKSTATGRRVKAPEPSFISSSLKRSSSLKTPETWEIDKLKEPQQTYRPNKQKLDSAGKQGKDKPDNAGKACKQGKGKPNRSDNAGKETSNHSDRASVSTSSNKSQSKTSDGAEKANKDKPDRVDKQPKNKLSTLDELESSKCSDTSEKSTQTTKPKKLGQTGKLGEKSGSFGSLKNYLGTSKTPIGKMAKNTSGRPKIKDRSETPSSSFDMSESPNTVDTLDKQKGSRPSKTHQETANLSADNPLKNKPHKTIKIAKLGSSDEAELPSSSEKSRLYISSSITNHDAKKGRVHKPIGRHDDGGKVKEIGKRENEKLDLTGEEKTARSDENGKPTKLHRFALSTSSETLEPTSTSDVCKMRRSDRDRNYRKSFLSSREDGDEKSRQRKRKNEKMFKVDNHRTPIQYIDVGRVETTKPKRHNRKLGRPPTYHKYTTKPPRSYTMSPLVHHPSYNLKEDSLSPPRTGRQRGKVGQPKGAGISQSGV